MAAPDQNAVELLPLTWQIIIGALTLATTVGGIVWRFLTSFNKKEPADAHVILERAELADMNAVRELSREFRPALERLNHIDQVSTHTAALIEKLLDKIQNMEKAAEIAKGVREELARRTEELERENRHRDRQRDRSWERDGS